MGATGTAQTIPSIASCSAASPLVTMLLCDQAVLPRAQAMSLATSAVTTFSRRLDILVVLLSGTLAVLTTTGHEYQIQYPLAVCILM